MQRAATTCSDPARIAAVQVDDAPVDLGDLRPGRGQRASHTNRCTVCEAINGCVRSAVRPARAAIGPSGTRPSGYCGVMTTLDSPVAAPATFTSLDPRPG